VGVGIGISLLILPSRVDSKLRVYRACRAAMCDMYMLPRGANKLYDWRKAIQRL
jgi:hypothetical protein